MDLSSTNRRDNRLFRFGGVTTMDSGKVNNEAPERIWIAKETLRISSSLHVGGYFDLGKPSHESSFLYVRIDPPAAPTDSKWYVATMNDCVFIIDRKPQPAPVDSVNPSLPEPGIVISMRSGGREAQEIAEQIVEAHNR